MKQILLNLRLLFIVALFISSVSNGQSFLFEDNLDNEGWTKAYGGEVNLGVDPNDNSKNCLIQSNLSAGPNSNRTIEFLEVTPNGIDATTNKIMKMVLRNDSNSDQFRVNSYLSDGSTSLWSSNVSMSTSASEYQTVYLNLSNTTDWTGEKLKFRLQFRKSDDPKEVDGNIYIDEITFFPLPSITYSTITSNPSFDDADFFHEWTSETKSYGYKEIEKDATDHTGGTSNVLKYIFEGTQDSWFETTNLNYIDAGQIYTEGTTIETTIWVKSNTGVNDAIFIGALLKNGATEFQKTATKTTTKTDGTWEQLTFTFSIGVGEQFDSGLTRISLPPSNAFHSGDIIYFDDIITTITPPTANTNNNYLEGVNAYPNPVKDNLTIEAPENSTGEIYNSTGSIVKSFTIHKNKPISTSNLNPGIYIIKVSNNGKTINLKVVID